MHDREEMATTPLAEAEALVGSLLADETWASAEEIARREERVLEHLAVLRELDPEQRRPLEVLAEWVRVRRRLRGA